MMIWYHVRIAAGSTLHVSSEFDLDFIETAERHIPKCKNIINKPKPPPGMRYDDMYGPHGDRRSPMGRPTPQQIYGAE
jgi:hypothetical protein